MSHLADQKYKDDYVQQLVEFVAADDFQNKFESFFLEHALEFTDDEELKLSYYDRYQEFQAMFEEELEVFCDSIGISQAELMRHCKDASCSDHRAEQYIQILLSSAEFDTFLKLMRIMRPVALMRLAEADNKNGLTLKPKTGRDDGRKHTKAEEELDFEIEATSSEMCTFSDAKPAWEVDLAPRRADRSDGEDSETDHKRLQTKQSK